MVAYNHTRRHSGCEMKPAVGYEQLLEDRSPDTATPTTNERR